jgi:3-phenylpropionate/trans-cinnamate dioxygenase ferredoxin reductase subunit
MNSLMNSVIVVGASAAGISCIRKLRKDGFAGELTLIDKDTHGAYERPPLSKQTLMAKTPNVNDILMISKQELESLGVKCVFGDEVVKLVPENRTLTLASGLQLTADAIVVATGGEARRVNIEGAQLPEVLVLRNFDDALKLRNLIKPDAKIAVVGGGFIGAETAASLASTGVNVQWFYTSTFPMSHVLPDALCEKLVAHLLKLNINTHPESQINKFVCGKTSAIQVEFSSGNTLDVDGVVLGVGMLPNTSFIDNHIDKQPRVNNARGFEVDESQATRWPGIYAAGDVALVKQSDGSGIRYEHWQSAQFQGERTAAAILGQSLPEEPTHWFWSDQGDLHIEVVGCMQAENAQLVKREEGDWPIYFCVKHERVVGAVSVNNPNAVRVALRMIKNDVNANPVTLADPTIALRTQMRG